MKRTRLNPISKSKHRREKRFVPKEELQAVKKRSGGRCERMVTVNGHHHRCRRPALDQPHHILPRSQGGKHTRDNLLDLCFECHTFAHNHPALAYAEGILKPYATYTP